jgi:hypothetical protein
VEPEATLDSDLAALLQQELARMPERYRDPILLCDLQEKSREEAASQLGLPEGTLSSRLARGREQLRQRLLRRGVTLSAALGVLLPESLRAAVPIPLFRSTIEAAESVSAGAALTGLVPASVTVLIRGGLSPMFLSRWNLICTLLLLTALTGLGTSLVALPALAEKPEPIKVAKDQPNKTKPEAGMRWTGTIVAVDAGKRTITLRVPSDTGKKEFIDKTLPLAADVRIELVHGLLKESRAGKLEDLSEGRPASAALSADGKSIVSLQAQGGSLTGRVKAIDAGKNTITVSLKGPNGLEERTVELVKEGKVYIDTGSGKKEPPPEGKLSELAEGDPVNVQLSGYDRKLAVRIARMAGPALQGTLKGIDLGNRTLTLQVKEDGGKVEKTLTLAKDAKVDGGKLESLTSGTVVSVRFAQGDKQTVVAIHVHQDK